MGMNKYNVWNKWGKLKSVMLGSSFDSSFFDSVEDSRLQDLLMTMIDQTNEDLAGFETILKQAGCNVIRPEVPDTKLSDYIVDGNMIKAIPKNILTPRDDQVVIGDKLFLTVSSYGDYNPYLSALQEYNSEDIIELPNIYRKDHKGRRSFNAPSTTLIGRDLYVDVADSNAPKHTESQLQCIRDAFPDIRINKVLIGGHNDSVFQPVVPGQIISIQGEDHYSKTFPGWEVCYLEGESWNKVDGWLQHKQKVKGKWWLPGADNNDDLVSYVETWLNNWVGYVEETVFDVNVFMLDEKTMCVTNPNSPIVKSFAKKNGIELVYVPWRHRYFWDGGLHCITLDLEREGEMEDFFPNRKKGIKIK